MIIPSMSDAGDTAACLPVPLADVSPGHDVVLSPQSATEYEFPLQPLQHGPTARLSAVMAGADGKFVTEATAEAAAMAAAVEAAAPVPIADGPSNGELPGTCRVTSALA